MLSNHGCQTIQNITQILKVLIISISFISILNSFIKKQSILDQTELKLIMELNNINTSSHIKFHDFWIYL
jgi:hypothetical protein